MRNKNLYNILEVNKNSTSDEIKSSYRKLSKKYHPDVNKEKEAEEKFQNISKAYSILSDVELKKEYDLKSKYGNNYNEYFEIFDLNLDFDYQSGKNNLDTFKRNEVFDIFIRVDDSFNGSIEYERLVKCKTCDGTGKDLSSKIVIKDKDGKVLRTFDAEDGCDFCDGNGVDSMGLVCVFCQGAGKIGLTPCLKCKGERRILGKQKISGITLTGDETKIESMGNCSKNVTGMVGNLYLRR